MQNIFLTFFKISFTTSLVIFLLFIAAPLFEKRFVSKWFYFLWLILAIRLLVPIDTLFIFSDDFFSVLPITDFLHIKDIAVGTESAALTVNKYSTESTNNNYLNFVLIFSILWLIGVIISLLRNIVCHFFYKKRLLESSTPINDERIIKILYTEVSILQIRTLPPIVYSSKASTPMLLGFIKPILILPLIQYEISELRYILRHELTHLKCNDIIYKLILMLVKTIHWYNPFVYLLVKEANKAIEFSCDEKILTNVSFEERKNYAKTIVNIILATRGLNNSLSPNLSTKFNGDTKKMKKRLSNIINTKKKRIGMSIVAFVFIITGIWIFIFSYINRPVDYSINGATMLNTQEWYNFGKKIKNTTTSSNVNGAQEIQPIESDILNDMENLFANTVTNIATVFSNEQYKIPAIITNSADMAIYTAPNGNGWYLSPGQVISLSFQLDLDTVSGSGSNGGVVEIGYILNGSMHIVEAVKSIDFSAEIPIVEEGEYYLYTTNLVSGYQILKDGIITTY